MGKSIDFKVGDEVLYELITQKEADKIKSILETTGLKDEINISVLNGMYKIKSSNITECRQTERYDYDMKEFYLMDCNDGYKVLEHKNKLYDIFINFGEWAYKTNLENAHITMGSSKFHDYSFQLELSQAIIDENNLYIVKNITNFAGPGALVRLYRGLGTNTANKESRKSRFIEELDSEIIKYKGKEWVVISKISLEDLFDDSKSEDIFYDLLNSTLKAMLLVEGIGE
ncbi:hypothetical protein [Clostridium diolis]|uniref:hypothetical protein n=1 Tax=Clostridium diolis TaxID=223919 RepID=UPI003AF8A69E